MVRAAAARTCPFGTYPFGTCLFGTCLFGTVIRPGHFMTGAWRAWSGHAVPGAVIRRIVLDVL
jgi:hypothetical protein